MKSSMGAKFRSLKGSPQTAMQTSIDFGRKLLFVGTVALALGVATDALAKGGVAGTAKPPKGVAPSAQTIQVLPITAPVFTNPPVTGSLTGLDVTGFLQDATVSNTRCAIKNGDPHNWGGTVKINGVTITIPCNTIVQMPANTLTWADFINLTRQTPEWDGANDKIKGFKTSGSGSPQQYEIQVVGNTLTTGGVAEHIGALVYVSQQSVNSGSGVITSIDYALGRIHVSGGYDENGVQQADTILEINDPDITDGSNPALSTGRFGKAHSPDERFSVDNQNPTIHSGTGYPMCVPRTRVDLGVDDPLCPQKNRPLVANGCRNFSQAGLTVLPRNGELPAPAAGDVYCKTYVMNPVTAKPALFGGLVQPVLAASSSSGNPALPDARQQAPFEVGDFIIWAGTLFDDGSGSGTDYVSAHTIEANVGIFTQPGTQPAYIAIGEFGLGTSDPATAVGAVPGFFGVAAEVTNRFFMEAATTDVISPIDIYFIDIDAAGNEHNRWLTPFGMTSECDPAPAVVPVGGVLGGTCAGVEGGISTQYTGPQNQRARIRAIKPPTNVLNQPSRYMRVVQRSLCLPSQINAGAAGSSTNRFSPTTATQDACIANATVVANGLKQGQYLAPVPEYIFPENTQAGQPIVPNDLWSLSFLNSGEGPAIPPLDPKPW